MYDKIFAFVTRNIMLAVPERFYDDRRLPVIYFLHCTRCFKHLLLSCAIFRMVPMATTTRWCKWMEPMALGHRSCKASFPT